MNDEVKEPVAQADEEPKTNVEDAFQDIFSGSVSGGGEEELLRIASDYALQLSASQIRALLWLELKAIDLEAKKTPRSLVASAKLKTFIKRWVELKRNHNSDMFVMRALDAISLRRLIGENSVKVDIQK